MSTATFLLAILPYGLPHAGELAARGFAAAVAAPLGVAAAPGQESSREALYFEAFHVEVALRDFDRAAKLYEAAASGRDDLESGDLFARCIAGQGRCLAALGRTVEARALFDRALEFAPGLSAALEGIDRLDGSNRISEELDDRIVGTVWGLADGASFDASAEQLVDMGDVAVPTLARLLRNDGVQLSALAAIALGEIHTRKSWQEIAAALSDPSFAYPRAALRPIWSAALDAITVPAFIAALDRLPDEERASFALAVRDDQLEGMSSEPGAFATYVRRLLNDPDPTVRGSFLGVTLLEDAVRDLSPQMVELSRSEVDDLRRIAARWLDENAGKMDVEVVRIAAATLAVDPDPSIRAHALAAGFFIATRSSKGSAVEIAVQALADADPIVFVRGLEIIENFEIGGSIPRDSHAILAAAIARLIGDPGLGGDEYRETLFSALGSLPILTDEELIDLYARAGEPGCAWSGQTLANARVAMANELLSRRVADGLDTFATSVFARVPDDRGRRTWFELCTAQRRSRPELCALAANVEDPDLRALAYEAFQWTSPERRPSPGALRFLAQDLRTTHEPRLEACLRVIREERCPELIDPLNDVYERTTGDLRTWALHKLAAVSGPDAEPLLRARMRETPQWGEFGSLDQLEAIAGDSIVPELVEIARLHGSAATVTMWMIHHQADRSLRVSPHLVESFVRALPRELLDGAALDHLKNAIRADLLAEIIVDALGSDDRGRRYAAISIAGELHVEAAWDELLGVLDEADGKLRHEAINALEKLREYRELRHTVTLLGDAEARREGFEKARALLSSADAGQRAGAALALGVLRDVRALPLLLDLLSDESVEVRSAATRAIEKLDAAVPPAAESGEAGG